MTIDEKKLIDVDKLIEDCKKNLEDTYTFQTPLEYSVAMTRLLKIIEAQPKLDVPDNNVGKWIPFKLRKADEKEREVYGYDAMLDCELPDEDEEVLITHKNGLVFLDTFCSDGCEYYLDSGYEFVTEAVAWCKPEPYKGEEK